MLGAAVLNMLGSMSVPIQPPQYSLLGKTDIPQSRAVLLLGYKNTTSLDMHSIPLEELQKSNANTHNTPSWNNNNDSDLARSPI